ncbi:MAG: DNA primase [Candidatus Cloacimonadota bacterium]|nr:MAG: DNA primase [Candidatus Cloacimonadota bacterium]
MKRILFLFLMTVSLISLNANEINFMSDPAISPDGKTICFSWMSDLWLVSSEGGTATKLTDSEAEDYNPVWSNNGKKIAFNSNRKDCLGIYAINSDGSELKKISEEGISVCNWFSDDKALLGRKSDFLTGSKLYKVGLDSKRPLEFVPLAGAYAEISNDDKKVVYSKQGYPYREKYEGSLNGDIWLYDVESKEYKRMTETAFTERYPVFSNDGENIYFVQPVKENFQIVKQNIETGKKKILTKLKKWSARDLSIAKNKDIIAFEYFDKTGVFDAESGKVTILKITANQEIMPETSVKKTFVNNIPEYDISPDGKFVAFRGMYDLMAVPLKGGKTLQLTHDQSGIGDILVLKDNNTILYTKFEKGVPKLYRTSLSCSTKSERIKLRGNDHIEHMEKSGGNSIVVNFYDGENYNQTAVLDSLGENIVYPAGKEICSIDYQISLDGKYSAFWKQITDASSWELQLLENETGKIHYLASTDKYPGNITWGKDYKSLYFSNSGDIYRLDLTAKDDFEYSQDNWNEILEKEKKESKKTKSTGVDLEQVEFRIKKIIGRLGNNYVLGMDSDTTFYYFNILEGKYSLRSSDIRGKDDKFIKELGKQVKNIFYHEKLAEIFYAKNNRLYRFNPVSKKTELVQNKFNYEYDKKLLNKNIFDQVWAAFGKGFYDKNMQGVNWEKSYKKFSPYLDEVYRTDQMQMIVEEMTGEVNASHTGFYPRHEKKGKYDRIAFLGCVLDYTEHLDKGIKITEVYRGSKLAKPGNIKAGDIILAVNDNPIKPETEITPLLADKVGKKIKLTVQTEDSVKTINIKGLSYGQNHNLYYDNMVEERKLSVDKLSNNRIGYLHIKAMNKPSLNRFTSDLWAINAEKDALIIDVRDNGGGWIHDYLIEQLTKKPYAYSTSRIYGKEKMETPARCWTKPAAVLINQNSFSDAEIFPHIFQELKLGKVIGVATSGSVIGTTQTSFNDGSSMRMPRSGWYTLDKENMEGKGCVPDIKSELSPQDIIDRNDLQLERAVKELLKEI